MKLSNKYISDVKIKDNVLMIIYSNGVVEKEEANYENYKNALSRKIKSLENFDINGLIELISKVKKYKLGFLGCGVAALLLSNFEILYFLIFMSGAIILHEFGNTLKETKDKYLEEINLENMSQYQVEAPILINKKTKAFTNTKDYEKMYLSDKQIKDETKDKAKVFIKTKK